MKKLYIKPETASTSLYLGDCLMINASVENKNKTNDSYMDDGGELGDEIQDGVANAKTFNAWDDWD